jgi:hypothetical protein
VRWTPIALSSLLTLGGCSFIDDFDFDIADGSVATDDGGAPDDGGQPRDGAIPDMGGVDASAPAACTDPCLGDAADDFGTTQGAGALQWTYLQDERDPRGLDYSPLTAGVRHGAPAWTEGSPPPAIVSCGESSEEGCASAAGGLLFEADQPGDGGDPVLTFLAPDDGTYAVVADVRSAEGSPSLTISRISRNDVVGTAVFSGSGSLTETVDLLEGERALIRVAPSTTPGGPASLSADIRVSRVVAGAPLADCQLAAVFSTDEELDLGCTSSSLTETGSVSTTSTTGPSGEYGTARVFTSNASLEADGLRMDYTDDFTIQLWLRVDDLRDGDPFVFSDLVAAVPENAGGVNLVVRRESAAPNDFEAQYAFPLPTDLPTDPSISCEESCRGSIVAPLPPLDEWHFFRLVRRTDADEIRLCIDGELVGTGWLDRDIEIPSPGDVKLGTTGVSSPRLIGAVDDLRVFSRALPCGD